VPCVSHPAMTSALRAADFELFHAALSVLLAPLDESSPATWRRRASEALQALMGADGAGIVLQLPGEPLDIGVGQWREQAQAAMDVYSGRHFGQNPTGAHCPQGAVRIWTRSALRARAGREPLDFSSDRCRHDGNFDSLGMSAPYPPHTVGEAAALITAGSPDRFLAGGREEQLLRLLQPAFAAGIAMLIFAHSWHEGLGAALDLADVPLAIVRPDGALLHATPALILVAGGSRPSTMLATVQAMARELARTFGGNRDLAASSHAVETPDGRYELRATLVQAAYPAHGPLVVVAVTPPGGAAPSGAELQGRFHLTQREVEVVRLLVKGARDRTIAHALGVQLSTARHHVEHVLMKLGIQARAAVAARVRDG